MRTLVPAFLILAAALTSYEATAVADPVPVQCQEGFCEPPTIDLFPSGSAQLPTPTTDPAPGAEHA